MANIGSFKKVGNEFQGEIVTLSVQTKGVRIVPETSRGNDNAPSHRVYVGRKKKKKKKIKGPQRLRRPSSPDRCAVIPRETTSSAAAALR